MSGAPCRTTEAIAEEAKENKITTLLLCFMVRDESVSPYFTYEWHAINPEKVNTTKHVGRLPAVLQDIPTDIPHMCASCALGSKIYVMGGMHYPNAGKEDRHESSKNVLVCDISSDPKVWKKVTPMNGPKNKSQVAVVDGKIYVFGSSMGMRNMAPATPWGEVYDPGTDKWTVLPDVQDILMESNPDFAEVIGQTKGSQDEILIASANAVNDKSKEIYIFMPPMNNFKVGMGDKWAVSFNVNTNKWKSINSPMELGNQGFKGSYVLSIDGETLIAALDEHLFVCDLSQSQPNLERVAGLEDATKTLKGTRFLHHLGNHKLCLVWTDFPDEVPVKAVHCLNFHLSPKGHNTGWRAIIDGFATYPAPSFSLMACVEVNGVKLEEVDLESATDVDRSDVEQHLEPDLLSPWDMEWDEKLEKEWTRRWNCGLRRHVG